MKKAMVSEKRDIDELLSPEGLSGRERERILAQVLGEVETAERPPWWRRWRIGTVSGGVMLAAAVAVVVLLVKPAKRDRDHAFTAKGESHARTMASVEVVCLGGTLARCPRGSTVLFRVDGLDGAGAGHLSAWAEPIAGSGLQRVWYFSAEDGSPPLVAAVDKGTVARSGARIGAEHLPGTYEVRVLVTSKPLLRADALAAYSGTATKTDGPRINGRGAARVEVVP